MRKTCLLLLFTAAALVDAAHAQSGAIRVICEDCRDPLEHPDDWANFAVNQIYGEEAWMDVEQADDFWIYNLDGDRVYVDVDFVMEGVRVLGNELPLWPANMLKLTLALPNGDILEMLRSVFMTPLPVPSTPEPDDGGTTGGDGESGEDGIDEPEPGEEEPEEPPEIEIVGTTGIEDPDSNGDFPETEWCEEC
jgi:hypothetical protein